MILTLAKVVGAAQGRVRSWAVCRAGLASIAAFAKALLPASSESSSKNGRNL